MCSHSPNDGKHLNGGSMCAEELWMSVADLLNGVWRISFHMHTWGVLGNIRIRNENEHERKEEREREQRQLGFNVQTQWRT